MVEHSDENTHISLFEAIRRTDEQNNEYWSARDLAQVLDYKTNYRNFKVAIDKAKVACVKSGHGVGEHFADTRNMITVGNGAQREVEDVRLSRYACYLVVMNADSSKEIVAQGQTYFAVQTRTAELLQQADLEGMSEDRKRLLLRDEMSGQNRLLAESAKKSGVVRPVDFAIFQDHGYKGLYGGEQAADIQARKALQHDQHILDHMGSDELIANLFRASLTKQKLEREQIVGKEKANDAHYEIGQRVRQTIIDSGAPPPEALPTPPESIHEIQRREVQRLTQGPQLSMFPEDGESGDAPPKKE